MTAAPPHLEVVTDLSTLCDRVTSLWPRHKLTPDQAGGIMRRLGRHGIHAILNAIDAHYAENLDGRAPNWTEIIWQLKRGKPRETRRREDGADYIRAWWRSWRDSTPDWASELLNRDEEAGDIQPADFEFWSEASLSMVWYSFRCLGRDWRQPGDREGAEVDRAPAGSAMCHAARRALLFRCNYLVRNLRTFGHATARTKEDWLRMLEADAERGQVKLETQEYPEAIDAF